MGLLKWLCRRFKCASECMLNVDDLPIDLLDIDLTQYQLTDDDKKYVWKIQTKRPSVHTYKHRKQTKTVEI